MSGTMFDCTKIVMGDIKSSISEKDGIKFEKMQQLSMELASAVSGGIPFAYHYYIPATIFDNA